MKIVSIIGLFSSLVIGVLVYISTHNLLLSAIFLILSLGYYLLIAHKRIKEYLSRIERTHQCYHFINTFLITLSVKESIVEAYSSATLNAPNDFQKELNEIENLDVEDRIIYLRRYFNLAIYKMFINVLNLYSEQGGDILQLGETLMHETTLVEESITKSFKIGLKKLVEYGILWILTFTILLFMRFGLNEFYGTMLTSNIFVICLTLFFAFFILSIHMFISKFVKVSVKEDKIDEEA